MNQWQDRTYLFDRLKKELLSHVAAPYHDAFCEFSDNFFAIISKEEMEGCVWENLVGSTLFLWKNILDFDGKTPKVTVFNPDENTMGWTSDHTVIHLIQHDTPFMVDSVRMKLNERGITTYLLLNCAANLPGKHKKEVVPPIGVVSIEIDRIEDLKEMKSLQKELSYVLDDVRRCVSDFLMMKTKVTDIASHFEKERNAEIREYAAYLRWLLDDNFTFLGYEEVQVKKEGKKLLLDRPSKTQLGLLKGTSGALARENLELETAEDFFSDKSILSFAKASARSTVHRPAYPDFIIIKRFDEKGNVCGEYRILGLYTSPVFSQDVNQIPILREKCKAVIKRSGFPVNTHVGKELIQVVQIFPREELFQLSEDQLFDTAMSILQIQERSQTKVFMRRDRNGLFCSVLVYVPREAYSTALRIKIQQILCKGLDAVDAEFFTFFSESVLARVHFILRLSKAHKEDSDIKTIANEIIDATSSWDTEFRQAMIASEGETKGIYISNAFRCGIPTSYKEKFSPITAVYDTKKCHEFSDDKRLKIQFYKLPEDDNGLRAKVFNFGGPLPLADQIPVMENLGLKVISEHPYTLKNTQGDQFWIHDFYLKYSVDTELPLDRIADNLQQAFCHVWYHKIENDRFNRLVLVSAMDSVQATMFRAYARYMKQINFGFSQSFIASALYKNVDISVLIWELFQTRFDVNSKLTEAQRLARQQQLQQELSDRLEHVSSLNEDRIIRRYIELICATLRTNFYQNLLSDEVKACFSFKISACDLSDIPKPAPRVEIFVYSPRFEGVHLRGGKVARGGLRWSDRLEDFRTEVLGLVKAQQVKNSVIVPVGAKGGFVCKDLPADDREAFMEEGIACYKQFIRSLLDVTDNLVDDTVIKPPQIICYDDNDYYLVVAADKGTATFSDIANAIAEEYKFWLGDAFASGGSVGYDHKKMGITAKGAWVSVQRHFSELGINIQEETITSIGIGDMSGDVFGNGMLLSEKLSLVAGFNHLHIFVDPNPDISGAFKERQRLFNLPRSSWVDYDASLISKGGGVFSRSAKSITITAEMKNRFAIKASKLTPTELIISLLRAPVDLLWNGGIGTYVKASTESNESVGDHANDALRINGNQLRCRVVGEGGNLGLTQLGRVEFSLHGGIINTDFIDNAGGVDCSDHEVNIKILLNGLVSQKEMTVKQRDKILEKMTENVSSLVLKNNYRQVQAISLAQCNVVHKIDEYRKLIHDFEAQGKLDRAVEFLPDEDQLNDRISTGKALTRPELSLLVSYSKGCLKEELLASEICSDPYLTQEMLTAFPSLLRQEYRHSLDAHRLKREITATQLSNYVCNTMGITFINRLQQFTGVSSSEVLRAFIIIRDIYGFDAFWEKIEALDFIIPSELQQQLMIDLRRSMRRLTRWMLQMNLMQKGTEETVGYYKEGVQYLLTHTDKILSKPLLENLRCQADELVDSHVPKELALQLSCLIQLPGMLFIIQSSHETGQPLEEVARAYSHMSDLLSLNWIFAQINSMDSTGHWHVRARESSRDEFFSYLKLFVSNLLECKGNKQSFDDCLTQWKEKNEDILSRWNAVIGELRLENKIELSMLTVLGRELLELYEHSLSV